MKRRFEYTDDRSNKFWQIELTGSKTIVTYGRIGTAGQSLVKQFGAAWQAQDEAERLVSEKTRKGYIEVGNDDPIPGAWVGKAKSKPAAKTKVKPKPQLVKGAGAVGARISAIDFDE